jgi:hypothetical protein
LGKIHFGPPNYYHFFIYTTKLQKLAYGYIKLQTYPSIVKKATPSALEFQMDGKLVTYFSFLLKYTFVFYILHPHLLSSCN